MANRTLTYKRNHPKNRSSYGIAGNVGIVVFQRSFFPTATEPANNYDRAGLPETIDLDVDLVEPKVVAPKVTVDAAAKAAEKAQKAQEKAAASAAKAAEKLAKAQAAVEAAKKKAEAAGAPVAQ